MNEDIKTEKMYQNEVSLCLKQEQISVNGVRKIILIQMENKIIFLTPLVDICSFKPSGVKTRLVQSVDHHFFSYE